MREFVQAWTGAFREHRLLTYATAIALRALICFVSLTFLALAVLGAVGRRDVWQHHIARAIAPKVTHPTFVAINAAAEKVFAGNSTGLIVFALLYALWQMSGSLRAVMDALNAIVDCDERRPTLYRYGLSVALAAVVIALIACALFVVAGADRLLGASGGVSRWLIAALRWPAAAIFLGLAVGIVARFAPVEHRGARWASVGATLIVVAWLVESAVYAWFLENVASYKSASGNLLLLIVLTTYLYISSVVFLVGAQLDEFLRQESRGRATTLGIHELARRLF